MALTDLVSILSVFTGILGKLSEAFRTKVALCLLDAVCAGLCLYDIKPRIHEGVERLLRLLSIGLNTLDSTIESTGAVFSYCGAWLGTLVVVSLLAFAKGVL